MEPNTVAVVASGVALTGTAAATAPLFGLDAQTLMFLGALVGALVFVFSSHEYKLSLRIPLAIISFMCGMILTPSIQTLLVNRGIVSAENQTIHGAIAFFVSASIISIHHYIKTKGIKGVAKDVRDIKKGVDDDN